MKKFLFLQKNGSGILTLSAPNYIEANNQLIELVKDIREWECDDEDGE